MSWTKISIDEICIGVATPPPTSSWTRRWNLALLVSGSDQREGGTGGGSEETGCGTTTNSKGGCGFSVARSPVLPLLPVRLNWPVHPWKHQRHLSGEFCRASQLFCMSPGWLDRHWYSCMMINRSEGQQVEVLQSSRLLLPFIFGTPGSPIVVGIAQSIAKKHL